MLLFALACFCASLVVSMLQTNPSSPQHLQSACSSAVFGKLCCVLSMSGHYGLNPFKLIDPTQSSGTSKEFRITPVGTGRQWLLLLFFFLLWWW